MSEILKSALPEHQAVHRRVADGIIADLRPVRRLWPISLRLMVWAIIEVAVLLYVVRHTHRTDLALQLTNPWYLLILAGFMLAGVIGAAFALRSAVPGRGPRAMETALIVVVASGSALLLLHEPFRGNVPLTGFIETGLPCAFGILIFAAVPWIALLWAVRRGAPLSAGLDGALIGSAAFFSSFALMRVNCPIDERSHLLVWHFLPAVAGIALSAWAGIFLLRRRNRR